MIRMGLTLVTTLLFAASAGAQAQAAAQAGAQASGQAAVQANRQGANASANGVAGSNAAVNTPGGQATLAEGTALNAALDGSVDSKKAKPGDRVTARTTEAVRDHGKVVLPKGTRLLGHVTQASARAKGDAQSALAVQFDRAILKHGREMPMHLSIQALASAQTAASLAADDMDTMGSAGAYAGGSAMGAGRGALGGVTSAAGGTVGTVTNTAANAGNVGGSTLDTAARSTVGATGAASGAAGGLNAAGQLTSNSRGVFGLNGLNLTAAGSNGTQGSLITSTGKNVHLDSGTRMLLVAQSGVSHSDSTEKAASPRPGPTAEPKPEPRHPNAKQPNNR
jgi:hypothetical protein